MNGLDENSSENLRDQLDPCFNSKQFNILLENTIIEVLFTLGEVVDIWRSNESTSKLICTQKRVCVPLGYVYRDGG